jgi:hypothetical protein
MEIISRQKILWDVLFLHINPSGDVRHLKASLMCRRGTFTYPHPKWASLNLIHICKSYLYTAVLHCISRATVLEQHVLVKPVQKFMEVWRIHY